MNTPRRQAIRKWISTVAICLLVAAVAAQLVLTLSVISQRQQSNTTKVDQAKRAAKAAQEGVDILSDCIDPKGVCGKRNAANQAQVLTIVKQFILDTAACQAIIQQPSDETALEQCVNHLEERRGQ